MDFSNNHYIRIDNAYRVIDGWSNGWRPDKDTAGAICITEHGGYHFALPGVEDNNLYTYDGIPIYKWDGTQVIPRTDEEIEADRRAIPAPPPSQIDRVEAQSTYTAMMTNTLMEV